MSNTYIIAEAGVNHNGSVDIAFQLIEAAALAGANAIKFQTFKTEKLVSSVAPKAEYQLKNTGSTESQFEMIKKLELNKEDHLRLFEYSIKKRIEFLSSPFDSESIDLLIDMGLETLKIPSGEITNLPYLRKIGATGKKIILSTGMCNMSEIKDAIDVLLRSGTVLKNISLLHCNTEYPTPYKDVNLTAMLTLKQKFGVQVGYSDHTQGIEISLAAVALGAELIEKHFTINKELPGPDHKASIEPAELKLMVNSIRNIEKALGDGIKKPSESEIKNIPIARKSIHYAISLKKGQIVNEDFLIMKRPGNGISPMQFENFLGRVLSKDVDKDSMLKVEDFE